MFELVTRPGLRRDVMLRGAMTDLGASPWQYMTSSHCDSMLYGYRGEMLDWDFVEGVYRVNRQDEASFTDEMMPRYDDFHRMYTPYYRLIGARALQRYVAASNGKTRLQQYLTHLSDDAGYTSSEVMPVYRPLELIHVDVVSDIGPVDAPRGLLKPLSVSGSDGGTAREREVRRAKSCVTPASRRPGDDDDVFHTTNHDNFLAVSHVQQTGV